MGHRRTRLSPTCNVAEFSRSRPNYERRQKGKKVKEADLYSAFIEVPYTQGAQVRITHAVLPANYTIPASTSFQTGTPKRCPWDVGVADT